MTPTRPAESDDSRTAEVTLSSDWAIRAMFGGAVAAELAEHAAQLVPAGRILASASILFARPAAPGAARVTTTLLRNGRSHSFVSCVLETDHGRAVSAQFTFIPHASHARADDASGPRMSWSDPDALPESWSPASPLSAVADRVDWRAESDWMAAPDRSSADGGPEFAAWIRAREPRLLGNGDGTGDGVVDPSWYLVAADLIGPAIAGRHPLPFGIATVTLDLQVLALTRSPWLRQEVRAVTHDSTAIGELLLLAPGGTVVATATQRAIVLPATASELPFSVTGFGYGVPPITSREEK